MTSALADTARIGTALQLAGLCDSLVTVRPAPPREPPFDDELAPDYWPVGPLDQPLPFGPSPRSKHRLRVVQPSRDGLPDPAGWGRRLLVGLIETAAGRRPLPQLTALLSRGVAAGIGADLDRATRSGHRHWIAQATVRTVRGCEPTDNVAELCATVQAGPRLHAVALRLEVRHGRWCCTRLLLG